MLLLLLVFLVLEFVDVAVAQVAGVPDQLLAVEARHHAVLERLFVPQELTQHSTKLEVVLAQVPQFEHLARYVEFLQLLLRRQVENRTVPAAMRQVI